MNIKIGSTDKELKRLFSWQARVGIAPKFGSRPIGWYQTHHYNVHKFLMTMAKRVGSYDAHCKDGTIYLGRNHIGSVNYVFRKGDVTWDWLKKSSGECPQCVGFGMVPPFTYYCRTCGRKLPEQGEGA